MSDWVQSPTEDGASDSGKVAEGEGNKSQPGEDKTPPEKKKRKLRLRSDAADVYAAAPPPLPPP
ncbi:MAG TPA: hypothetical protein VFG07_08965 [Thermoplasmata archaeon]|nr:hypothetical protein [Thermoplasmata archaeon]